MPQLFEKLKESLAAGRLVALVTVVAGPGLGQKLLVWPDGRYEGLLDLPEIMEPLLAKTQELLQAQRSARLSLEAAGEPVEFYIEIEAPPARLIMVGAVHIAVPLATFAKALDFRTIVIDARGVFATAARFPHVDELIVRWPAEALAEMTLDQSTFVTFLTHDEKFDDPALEVVLNSPVRYVGALGSRRTHAKRVERLGAMGLSEAQIERIHAPIGLDIGAARPEEIAVSIMAEIVAVMNGKKA